MSAKKEGHTARCGDSVLSSSSAGILLAFQNKHSAMQLIDAAAVLDRTHKNVNDAQMTK